jgi:type IV pilus assembly protein PilY1
MFQEVSMNPKKFHIIIYFFLFFIVSWFAAKGWCDDTCIFSVTADDVPPYIVLLMDNGAEMEQIVWASTYDPNTDYTTLAVALGSPFTNPRGYALYYKNGANMWLSPIKADLSYPTSFLGSGANYSSSGTFTVTFLDATTKSIDLPLVPSYVDGDGVKDNATQFRYATNYLNWLFYSKWINDKVSPSPFSSSYDGDGSDLPDVTRFYVAKTAILKVAGAVRNRAKLGIFNFTNDDGASSVQPLKLIWDEGAGALDSAFFNNVNNMGTNNDSPLAEGLQTIGGYYDSNSSGVPSDTPVSEYCGQLFTLIVSPGVSSEDEGVTGPSYLPSGLDDYDKDSAADDLTTLSIKQTDGSFETYTIPTNSNGTTYLDDVAGYLYTNDMVSYVNGFQRVSTYTVGFMGDDASNAFLINTSNNGNGNFGLYDENDEEYGKYHREANDPNELAKKMLEAINAIISRTTVFTAPVVPVTRTTSGNSIYLALFKPQVGNFWEGNLTKFGIGMDTANDQLIITDQTGAPATHPNGALKEDATPYWETKDWADPTKSNYVHNGNRNIYTFLGSTTIISTGNAFSTTNGAGWTTLLGSPIGGADNLIDYIRGADVLDEDEDGNTSENRSVITGDILHSEPAVVNYSTTGFSGSVIFFGANDGMLHAVKDADGTEMWGFIPPDLLSKLKALLEGTGHPYYVDASPKVFISGDHDNVVNEGDEAYLVFGERGGGDNYWALDITDPTDPSVMWNITSASLDLGETWSEPVFAKVKTSAGDTTGTNVMIVGGGYSADNSKGKLVAIIDLSDGSLVEKFNSLYCIPSSVNAVEIDNNSFVDKIYVGNMGGQMLRIGKFTEDDDLTPLTFPEVNEDISAWGVTVLFETLDSRKIMYPPSVTLEKSFDLVFFGTGDRTKACDKTTSDRIYAVVDDHSIKVSPIADSDLQNVALGTPIIPGGSEGFYLGLEPGEKILAKGTVFNKVYYITSFIPDSTDPCTPGGYGRLYALDYKTGEAVIDFDGDGTKDGSMIIGGGIPSKPVMVIPPKGDPRMLISVGSTNPDPNSPDTPAGIVNLGPDLPAINFFYLWWRSTR